MLMTFGLVCNKFNFGTLWHFYRYSLLSSYVCNFDPGAHMIYCSVYSFKTGRLSHYQILGLMPQSPWQQHKICCIRQVILQQFCISVAKNLCYRNQQKYGCEYLKLLPHLIFIVIIFIFVAISKGYWHKIQSGCEQ